MKAHQLDPTLMAPQPGQFFLCEACRKGTNPQLCQSCRHNIELVEELQRSLRFLKSVNGELRAEIGVLRSMNRSV